MLSTAVDFYVLFNGRTTLCDCSFSTVIQCTSLTLRLLQTLKKESVHNMKTLKKEPVHKYEAFCFAHLLFLLITAVHDFYQSGRDRGRKERDVRLKVTAAVNGRRGEGGV